MVGQATGSTSSAAVGRQLGTAFMGKASPDLKRLASEMVGERPARSSPRRVEVLSTRSRSSLFERVLVQYKPALGSSRLTLDYVVTCRSVLPNLQAGEGAVRALVRGDDTRLVTGVLQFEGAPEDLEVRPPRAHLVDRRRERIERFRARSDAFSDRASEVRAHAAEVGATEPFVAWSNRSVYTEATLDGLAALAEHSEVAGVGLATRGRMVRSFARATGRSIDYHDLAAGVPSDGGGTVVACVDGSPAAHAELRAPIAGEDFTGQGLGVATRHATMVAGLIVGAGPGCRGVAPGADYSVYKILAGNGGADADEEQVVRAIVAAAERGDDIINCSFSFDRDEVARRLDQTMASYIADGAVFVRSAGNDGAATFSRPHGAPGLIVVGACDPAGTTVAPYSNGGDAAGTPGFVMAPGGVPGRPLIGLGLNNTTVRDTGTSFAAAIVSGLAATALGGGAATDAASVLTFLRQRASGPVGTVLVV